MWLWKLPSSTALFSFALNVKTLFFPQPKGDLYMKLMHKITSKGPLNKYNAGGESMLWTLFPLFVIHEVSVQIEMKDYWGNFANTWKSNFYFALVNYIIVKEERKIAKRLCYWKWHNHDPVLTIGVCKSSLVVSKFCTELLKSFSLIHQTKRNNTLLKAQENFVYFPILMTYEVVFLPRDEMMQLCLMENNFLPRQDC